MSKDRRVEFGKKTASKCFERLTCIKSLLVCYETLGNLRSTFWSFEVEVKVVNNLLKKCSIRNVWLGIFINEKSLYGISRLFFAIWVTNYITEK